MSALTDAEAGMDWSFIRDASDEQIEDLVSGLLNIILTREIEIAGLLVDVAARAA